MNNASQAAQNEQLQNLVLANTMYFHNLIISDNGLRRKHFHVI